VPRGKPARGHAAKAGVRTTAAGRSGVNGERRTCELDDVS
jgi:hypothetical protein